MCETARRPTRLSVDTHMLMPAVRVAQIAALIPFLLSGQTAPPAPLPTAPPSSPPARQVGVGRIEGRVEVSSALAARRPRFRIYADAGPGSVPPPSPQAGDDISRELRNVVVYVGGEFPSATLASRAEETGGTDSAGNVPSAPAASMAQSNERFEPHVLPIVQGTRVEFPNRDDVYHNVFSLSSTRSFDLGRYPKGGAKSITFEKTGAVQLFCHIHSDMSGIVLVLPNQHFSAPQPDGRYSIENVPAGEYAVIGWHERTKPVSKRVRVVAGETARVDFSLPLGPRAQP